MRRRWFIGSAVTLVTAPALAAASKPDVGTIAGLMMDEERLRMPTLSLGRLMEPEDRVVAVQAFDRDIYLGTTGGLFRISDYREGGHIPRMVKPGRVYGLSAFATTSGERCLYVFFGQHTDVIEA